MSNLNDNSLNRAEILTTSERNAQNAERYAREKSFEGVITPQLAKKALLTAYDNMIVRYYPQENRVIGRTPRGYAQSIKCQELFFTTEKHEGCQTFEEAFVKNYFFLNEVVTNYYNYNELVGGVEI